MTTHLTDILEHLDRHFRRHARIAAENSKGKYSATWIFWGKKSDFYFGAKSVTGALKVSLHENGVGYVGYDKQYYLRKRAEGFTLPTKTVVEWPLPKPGERGAVLVARVLLPADYCCGDITPSIRDKKTLVVGVGDTLSLQIDIFFSREAPDTLENKFTRIGGNPLFAFTLSNGVVVSLVAQYTPFDKDWLPLGKAGRQTMLQTEITTRTNLNAIFWNDPREHGVLCLTDIGGLTLQSENSSLPVIK